MHTKLIIVSIVLTFICGLRAVVAAPRLECKEDTFDFNAICSTQSVSHVFILENTGDEPVTIRRIRSSCGCTTVVSTKQMLAPGEQEKVAVTFNAKGRHGTQNRSIFVSWNSADKLPLKLIVKGKVFNCIEGQPDSIDFGTVVTNAMEVRTFRLYDPASNAAFRVTGITIPHAAFSNRLETVVDGHDYVIHIYTTPYRTPGVVTRTALTVTTDNPELIAFRMPITMRTPGRRGTHTLLDDPDVLNLPENASGENEAISEDEEIPDLL